jgi:hypothetical protein
MRGVGVQQGQGDRWSWGGGVMRRLLCWCVLLATVACVLVGVVGVGVAFGGVWWHVQSGSRPSFLLPGGSGEVVATVSNLGDAGSGGVVSITDVLPVGLSAKSVEGEVLEGTGGEGVRPVVCSPHPLVERPLVCTVSGSLAAYDSVEMRIGVVVDAGAKVCKQNSPDCEQNQVGVSAPGTASVSVLRPVTVSEEVEPFGVEAYEVAPEEEGGGPTVQAGKHPFQVTGTLTMNETGTSFSVKDKLEGHPVALAKDLAGLLPPGLIGNPTPFARCSITQLDHVECPPASVVGVVTATVNEPVSFGGLATFTTPIANMEPARGEPARFGFFAASVPVFLNAHVRSGGDYGITLGSDDIPQTAAFLSYKLTFWGVPGAAAHDSSRTQECLLEAREKAPAGVCKPLGESKPPPLLAMPTACTGPLRTSTEADAWDDPQPEGQRLLVGETEPMPAMQGCNRLPFEAQVQVTPDGTAASTPTGLRVDVHVPQESILNATSLAQSAVKDITVTLPQGVAVNPAGGNGLQACSEPQVGFEGFKEYQDEPGVSVASFTPTLPEPLEPGLDFCSTASKIGTVEVSTPLLPVGQHLTGAVYLASQNANPFGSLLALYLVAEDPVSGTVFKSTGETSLSASGQITGVFKDNPQLAFEDAEIHFFGGERGPLATPAQCGSYTTTASFVPWAAEPWDEQAVTTSSSSTFDITSGPRTAAQPAGSPCPGPALPFSPSLTGGTTNISAGAFTPLTTTIAREDGQQSLQQVQLSMPPGVSGMITGTTLCGEEQANAGSCPEASLIGETTVSAGVGNDPVSVKGGKVYLTEKYDGAPFGLSIVNPVKAGPFDLEHDTANPAQDPPCDCVVVRARIQINPITAALTVTTNEGPPYWIPHMIDGVPVQIKAVNVTITKPGFTFNPTNCEPKEITGTITSAENTSAPVAVPFQVTNCAALKFQPQITVTTAAQASKANGASLTFKIAYPQGAQGQDAWFKEAKFDLPKQLPARLGTLQQACLAAVFEANPASCPTPSRIGSATVHTQVLPVPLQGPVYFVSYGGAKFPEAVLVLQGDNVTVDLHGETYIDNATGVTSATFKSTPDVPFENIEVNIPEGPYSEFGANLPPKDNYNFCGQTLTMPTHFTAQNGLQINQNTPITTTGCKKTKPPTPKQQLAKALKACKKTKNKHKRATCEKHAHNTHNKNTRKTKKT